VTLTVTSGSTTSSTPTSTSSSVGTIILTWDPSTTTNLAGYKVYQGTASGVYSSPLTVGNVTSYTISNLGVGSTYYFAVTDYTTSGIESGFSNEVSKSIY
jgi:fibronectin type 3 domain-containing protein